MITGLKLRTGDLSIQYGERIIMTKRWEAYHPQTGDVVASGTVQRRVPSLQKIADADLELEGDCQSRFANVKANHAPRGAIGDLSAFDADLVLDGWMQDEEGLDHPLLGHIDGTPPDAVRRVNAIVNRHAPPPAWFWAEVEENGVAVKCTPVAGAESYAVLDGNEFLGTVPDEGWNSITTGSGTYNVRMAAVVDSIIGVPSFVIPLTVGTVTIPLEMMALGASSPGLWARFKAWLLA